MFRSRISVSGYTRFLDESKKRIVRITFGKGNPSMAVKPLDSSEWSKSNLGQRGLGAVITISESGLYKLIMRSDKPEAKGFQDWVTKV